MARARNIKPSLFKNEVLGVLDPLITLLFQSLWCLADREGRLEDRPLRIKAETFPYRESMDINGYLTVLEQKDFIRRYEVYGKRYIQVINFRKHQSPHKTEKASEIPPPPEKSTGCEGTVKPPLNNGEKTEPPPPDSLIPDSLNLNEDSLRSSSCGEPEKTGSSPETVEPVFISLPLNDSSEHSVTESQIAEWGELFPAVDVRQELRNMRAWLLANTKNRKTRSGVTRFVTSWLTREQNRARRTSPSPPSATRPGKEFPDVRRK